MKKAASQIIPFSIAMVSAIAIAMVGIMIATLPVPGKAAENVETDKHELYSALFMVKSIDEDNAVLNLINCNGNEFKYDKTEGWNVGDYMTAIMDNNGTEGIFDDIIISVNKEYPYLFRLYEIRYGINGDQ
jgi:hypothetical protein